MRLTSRKPLPLTVLLDLRVPSRATSTTGTPIELVADAARPVVKDGLDCGSLDPDGEIEVRPAVTAAHS